MVIFNHLFIGLHSFIMESNTRDKKKPLTTVNGFFIDLVWINKLQ